MERAWAADRIVASAALSVTRASAGSYDNNRGAAPRPCSSGVTLDWVSNIAWSLQVPCRCLLVKFVFTSCRL